MTKEPHGRVRLTRASQRSTFYVKRNLRATKTMLRCLHARGEYFEEPTLLRARPISSTGEKVPAVLERPLYVRHTVTSIVGADIEYLLE